MRFVRAPNSSAREFRPPVRPRRRTGVRVLDHASIADVVSGVCARN
jgi:hypothetical protein